MDVGIEGVIFIWAIFLWPIIVTSLFLGIFGRRIEKKAKYWFVSVLVGYVFLISANYLASFWFFDGLDVEDLRLSEEEAVAFALKANVAFVISMALPALVSFVLLRRYRE